MSNQDFTSHFEELVQAFNAAAQDSVSRADHKKIEAANVQREEAARRGELGEDWQTIQERIDNNETTLRDVFSGKDDSDAAVALRQTAQRSITKAMQQIRKNAEDNDEEDPFVALQESLAAIRKETEQRIRNLRGF